jgi:O-antigen/teichoic acid export membrane protein
MPGNDDDLMSYKTAQGTLYLFLSTILTSATSSIFFMFIARYLPTISAFGLISGLQLLINMCVIFAGLGLTNAATRFMSYYFGADKHDTAREVSILIFRIGLFSSLAISTTLYLLASPIAVLLFHDNHYTYMVQLASIDIFFLSMVSFFISILYSLQEFKRIFLISVCTAFIKCGTAFLLLISGMGISGILTGYIVGDAICFLAFLIVLKIPILKNTKERLMRTLFSYSLPLFGSSTLTFLSTNVDYYLVLILTSLSIAGIYSPAVLIGVVLLMILTSLEQTLLPYFSRLYGKSDMDSLRNKSIVVSRYLFLIYLPLGFATFACSPVLITGIFGERYAESVYPAMIIILAITLTSIGTVFNNVLKSVGRTSIFLISTLSAVTVQLLISIFTIPSFGAIGAAMARSSAYAIMLIVPAIRLKQVAGLPYDMSALQNGLVGSVAIAFIILILNSIFDNPFSLLISLPVAFLSYLVILRIMRAMNSNDFEVMNNIFPGKIKWPLIIITKIVLQ